MPGPVGSTVFMPLRKSGIPQLATDGEGGQQDNEQEIVRCKINKNLETN